MQAAADAEAAFRDGRKAVQAGDWATACARVRRERTHRAGTRHAPQPRGLQEDHAGHLVSAHEHFGVAASGFPRGDARRTLALAREAQVDKRIVRLTLRLAPSAPPDAVVHRGDAVVPASALGASDARGSRQRGAGHCLGAGARRSRLHAEPPRGGPGRADARGGRCSDGHAGAVTSAAPAPDAVPVPAAPPATGRGRRTVGFVLGGIGVAGLATGAVTGLLALNRGSTVKSHCPDLTCDPQGLSAASQGQWLAPTSTVAFIAGGVLVAARRERTSSSSAAATRPAWPSLLRSDRRRAALSSGESFRHGQARGPPPHVARARCGVGFALIGGCNDIVGVNFGAVHAAEDGGDDGTVDDGSGDDLGEGGTCAPKSCTALGFACGTQNDGCENAPRLRQLPGRRGMQRRPVPVHSDDVPGPQRRMRHRGRRCGHALDCGTCTVADQARQNNSAPRPPSRARPRAPSAGRFPTAAAVRTTAARARPMRALRTAVGTARTGGATRASPSRARASAGRRRTAVATCSAAPPARRLRPAAARARPTCAVATPTDVHRSGQELRIHPGRPRETCSIAEPARHRRPAPAAGRRTCAVHALTSLPRRGDNCGTWPNGCGNNSIAGPAPGYDTCAAVESPNVCGGTHQVHRLLREAPNGCGGSCPVIQSCCGGGCFVAGTMITMADGTFEPIDRMRAGELAAPTTRRRETSSRRR